MNKSKFTLFTASLALATALTLSCSSDDGDGNEDGLSSGGTEISSSSEVTESSSSADNDGNLSSSEVVESSSSADNICGGEEYDPNTKICFADKVYGIVTFEGTSGGKQTWMAENLNYETATGSWCYDDDEDNCDIYGRLYTWDAAMDACASGWHLPSREEWDVLVDYAGEISTAGTKLKATSGWGTGTDNGTDDYGFSAMPGGSRDTDVGFFSVGSSGYWWSATEYSGTSAYYRSMSNSGAYVDEDYYLK